MEGWMRENVLGNNLKEFAYINNRDDLNSLTIMLNSVNAMRKLAFSCKLELNAILK